MVSRYLSQYKDWVLSGNKTKEGMISFLDEIGWDDVAFINQTQVITKLDASSDGFMVFLQSYFENPNFVIDPKTGTTNVHGQTFPCILRIARDDFGNKIYIIGRTDLSPEDQEETKLIAHLAYNVVNMEEKLTSLELALPLLNQPNALNAPINWPQLSVSKKFIEDAIPSVWYSVAHEMMGPMIVASEPNELTQSEYLDKVVNVYSIMRTELIVELGHVFSVLPVSNPYGGESTNVIFTIPNPNARGGVELHGVSVTIGRDFVNLSKIAYNEIKMLIFNLVDFIKTVIGRENWELSLEKDPMYIRDKIFDLIHLELENTREQFAKLVGSLLGEQDLENWSS